MDFNLYNYYINAILFTTNDIISQLQLNSILSLKTQRLITPCCSYHHDTDSGIIKEQINVIKVLKILYNFTSISKI